MTHDDEHRAAASSGPSLLSVRDLCVDYLGPSGAARAVSEVSFELRRGEVLGLAGESGSGKSTIAQALLRTLGPPAVIAGGSVLFEGRDVLAMDAEELREFRWRRIAVVFQSAMSSLNPVMRIRDQLVDSIEDHGTTLRRQELDEKAAELLRLVGLDPAHQKSYPHQLSGGMRQRVGIAAALALRPDLLILDEPTTALDVVVEREIMQQIASLRARLGFAVLFITHDLGLLSEVADTVAIVYAGQIVEIGPATAVLERPEHPYTRGLLASFPPISGQKQRLLGIGGSPPRLGELPSGCRFHPRCPERLSVCSSVEPRLLPSKGGAGSRSAACHLLSAPEGGTP